MGASFSAFNKFGLPGLTTATTGQVYENHFKGKEIRNFEDFHVAYVEFCKYFNTIMPGQDFSTPTLEEIRNFYEKWKGPEKDDEKKKQEFFEYMKKNVEAKMGGDVFIMVGLAAPAAAVIGKRASGHIPYLKNMRLDLVPNVIFVPVCTLGAIVLTTMAQISRKGTEAQKKSAAAEKDQREKSAAAPEKDRQKKSDAAAED